MEKEYIQKQQEYIQKQEPYAGEGEGEGFLFVSPPSRRFHAGNFNPKPFHCQKWSHHVVCTASRCPVNYFPLTLSLPVGTLHCEIMSTAQGIVRRRDFLGVSELILRPLPTFKNPIKD